MNCKMVIVDKILLSLQTRLENENVEDNKDTFKNVGQNKEIRTHIF